jgi:hypothetical protein
MIVDISIRIGNYRFHNGHLYKFNIAGTANGKYKVECWTCLFCKKHEHQNRKINEQRSSKPV